MIIATLITYIIQPDFTVYNSYARTIYLVLWIVACGLFFIDVMLNDNRVSLVKQPGFWLATGILFFSVIFIILISLYQIFTTLPNYKIFFRYFIIVANTFMYVGFAGAFICQHIATKYYSRSLQQA
jgi:magnesium-transporting ATPase (P-type)